MTIPTRETMLEKALWYSFLLYIALLGTMKPMMVIYGQRVIPADLIFVAVAVLFGAAILFGKIKLRSEPLLIAIGLFFAAMCVSAVFSSEPARSGGKLVGVGYLAAIAVITCSLVSSPRRLKAATFAFICGAAVAVFVGLFTIALFYVAPHAEILGSLTHHYGSVPVGNYPRVSSTFVSPSMLMNFLSVAMVLLLIARVQHWVAARWYAIGITAAAVCCVFTLSIGLGALFLIFAAICEFEQLPKSKPLRRLIQAVCLTCALAFVAIAPFALQPNETAGRTMIAAEVQPSARLLVWEQAFSAFTNHPFTGVGLGMPTASVVFRNTDGTMSRLTDAHNVFLSIAAQAGLIGLAGLIFLCFRVLKSAFAEGIEASGQRSIRSLLGFAFIVAFLYQGLTGSFEDARHLWVLIGLIPAAASLFSSGANVAD